MLDMLIRNGRIIDPSCSIDEIMDIGTPARAMKMGSRIGTLKPGAAADIAIFALQDGGMKHLDSCGETFETNRMFQPQMTVIDGEIAFCRPDFNIV